LPIEDFKTTVFELVEVDEPERVSLEERVDDCNIALAVRVDVVALVLGLDGEPTGKAEEPTPFKFVLDEPVSNFADCEVSQISFHFGAFRWRRNIRA